MKNIIITISIVIILIALFLLILNRSEKVDMLLINGKVYTLDSANSVVEAIAIRGDKIIGVGSTSEITGKFDSDNIIDLKGKTVLPGLIDGHAHLLGEGGRLEILDLVGTTSVEQITEMVKDKVKKVKTGDWILGRGWDQNNWVVKEFPTMEALNRAS
ncbi:MAG: amidohydrolase family protein, partial [Ignavibacteriales bacterium]|nr:amidohydrolase family protein [Ignavibacteriales bacterium]